MSLEDIEKKLGELIALVTTTKVVSIEIALAAAGDYAAEDVLSESASNGIPWVFEGIAKRPGGSGEIKQARIMWDTTALTPRCTLYLYKGKPTSEMRDNVASTGVIAADKPISVGKIDFPALEDLGGVSEAIVTPSTVGNLPLAFTCASGEDKLRGILVTRDAITGESAGAKMTIELTAEQF